MEADDAEAAEVADEPEAAKPPAVRRPAAAATRPVRLPPRETLSPDGYRDLAATLRETYSRPAAEWPRATIDEGVEAAARRR